MAGSAPAARSRTRSCPKPKTRARPAGRRIPRPGGSRAPRRGAPAWRDPDAFASRAGPPYTRSRRVKATHAHANSSQPGRKKVCIVGASGKLGRYIVQHALDRGYDVVGVCREQSVPKLDDQAEACRRIFASDRRWTVVRGSDLEEGPSQGLPVWSRHVGGPVLASNLTRRTDFALFMVEALDNDGLIHEAPAIAGRKSVSAVEAVGAEDRQPAQA